MCMGCASGREQFLEAIVPTLRRVLQHRHGLPRELVAVLPLLPPVLEPHLHASRRDAELGGKLRSQCPARQRVGLEDALEYLELHATSHSRDTRCQSMLVGWCCRRGGVWLTCRHVKLTRERGLGEVSGAILEKVPMF